MLHPRPFPLMGVTCENKPNSHRVSLVDCFYEHELSDIEIMVIAVGIRSANSLDIQNPPIRVLQI
jgi:hypothetical protein